jgi:hypothetical protein
MTPYELATASQHLGSAAVLICSAGGSNPDVITVAEHVIRRTPHQLFAITTRAGSPLEKTLNVASWPRCHAFETPTKKDGFLATNSLLATIVLLTRAYEAWAGSMSCLPSTLGELLRRSSSQDVFIEQFRECLVPVVSRTTVVVLNGATTKPAAMDVESRFTEAGLANVQTSDFRNFAHGRHHWLARHAESSAVLAFAEDGDEIAKRTLTLLPPSIPRWQVSVQPGLAGAVAAVCTSIIVAEIAGKAKGVDPGRPHVPAFGRKLYHLKAMPRLHTGDEGAHDRMSLAIERKTGLPICSLAIREQLDAWTGHYSSFIERLSNARIRAIVLDYDGTLCPTHGRLSGPSIPVIERLAALLAAGTTVAVATGRGKSVREALCRHITSPEQQARIIVGYHNGEEIAPLTDAACPRPERSLAPELALVARALRDNVTISRQAAIEAKGKQISLELLPSGDRTVLLDEVVRILRRQEFCGTSLVTSSHSVDIIAPGVSKSNVLDDVVKRLGLSDRGAASVLCIGDRGRAPGNDADLLRHPLSLSVDEVSGDPSTCWAIAEPGLRFDLACLEYLTRLRPCKAGLRFDVKGVKP